MYQCATGSIRSVWNDEKTADKSCELNIHDSLFLKRQKTICAQQYFDGNKANVLMLSGGLTF